jgi:phage shock protein PspC (stress-responsive transcriptional regulator)
MIANGVEAMEAQDKPVALPLRSHTILGVCEAIGEDFGFNPVLLRIPFGASVLWSPMWAIVAYLVLGSLVLASRLLFRQPKVDAPASVEQPAAAANAEPKLPLAA